MKRILSFLLSIFLFFSSFVTVFAEGWSFCDLSEIGIAPMMASFSERPTVLDGKISEGEYGSAHISALDSGLCAASFQDKALTKNETDQVLSMNPHQESYLSFDDEYIYCGIKTSVQSEKIPSFIYEGIGNVYPISLSIGLTPGEHPANRCSFLTNTYYFSQETLRCVAVSGERIVHGVDADTRISLCISNLTEFYRENGYKDAAGILWNADYYCQKAVLEIEKAAEYTVLCAEFVIPLGDALLSVSSALRDQISAQLKDKSGTLCGSFLSKVCVSSKGASVVCGLLSSDPSPVSEKGETWKDYIKENYETPISGSFVPDFLPIPLYFLGSPPKKSDKLPENETENNLDEDTLKTEDTSPEKENPSPSKDSNSPPLFSSNIVKNEETEVKDESIFDSLPDENDFLPEDTEIVYDESKTTETEKEEKGSLIGSVFTMLAGVLLFASMIVLVFFYRNQDEKNEKEKENKTKKSKKGK